ncbi:MAG TPA: thioredoxin [Paracoccaceae bacterium]|nr:thioredoxin [Paracoccaceae bacterium]
MELKAAAASDDELIRDGSDATFMADVIEASAEVPVIVDFWAPWCGPCKTLTPALEQAVREARGKVRLVKVDVDQNQMIAAQLRVQSIPTVYAFVNGQPVDAFQGALPGSQIKQFIERLIAMSGGDAGLTEALDQADAMLAEGAAADAAQVYSAVLGEEQENTRAIAGLARCYLALDDVEKARATLALVPQEKAGDPAIASVEAQIALADEAAGAGDASDLRARVERNPDDHQARYDLAMALVARGDEAGAIDALIELFRRDREWNDGAARTQLLKIFDSLGPKSEVAQKGRRRLSSLIFS